MRTVSFHSSGVAGTEGRRWVVDADCILRKIDSTSALTVVSRDKNLTTALSQVPVDDVIEESFIGNNFGSVLLGIPLFKGEEIFVSTNGPAISTLYLDDPQLT